MAQEINNFFANVGENLAASISAPDSNILDDFIGRQNIYPQIMEFTELTNYDIAVLVRDLRPSTSCGVDGLNARIIKAAGPSIFPVLCHIFNLSLRSQKFPSSWKISCITPLSKDGDATDPSNYRPISVLPALGKLLERVAHTQLYSYFHSHDIFSHSQSGFRKGHSTQTCLLDFLDNVYQEVDQGRVCVVLFLDLRKAFDTVNHNILTEKLIQYGLEESSANWLKSYISGRKQITKISNVKSESKEITWGVPQGSILGPLLFTVYINDLPIHLVNSKCNLYADDTAITVSGRSVDHVSHLLNTELRIVSEWFKWNKLSLKQT